MDYDATHAPQRYAKTCKQCSTFPLFEWHYNRKWYKKFPLRMETTHFSREFSAEYEAKDTWLECQGYNYEPNPGDFASRALTDREAKTKKQGIVTLIGKFAADNFY